MEIKDKNGELIKDGDRIKSWVLKGEPILGTRVGDEIHWDDGIKHSIEEYWVPEQDEKLFEKI